MPNENEIQSISDRIHYLEGKRWDYQVDRAYGTIYRSPSINQASIDKEISSLKDKLYQASRR